LVFAGPGSPTYALRQWQGTLVPPVLAEKLALGGALTFASAAALTLGVVTVPVYEVYKVGEDPRWVPGLDLLDGIGLPVALIPHYDNAEGGTHDTRFCYLGEDRLALLERELPDRSFVLGVDEHTALALDLEAGTAAVAGHGGVTVRVQGRSARLEAGETMPVARILELAAELASGHTATSATATAPAPEAATAADSGRPPVPRDEGPPLLGAIRRQEETFRAARVASDVRGMVEALLALDDELWAWSADTLQSDFLDRGRASLRSMVAELGELAALGARDPSVVVGPFVELALTLRESARRERRFDDADAVRDRLVALGVEVNDSPDGSAWRLSNGEVSNGAQREDPANLPKP
jgi:hypothetical protein